MQVVAYLKKPAGEEAGFQHFDPGISLSDANSRRASIARGAEIFSKRTFTITGAAGLNTGSKPVTGTCASCHDVPMSGMSSVRFIDTGSTNQPWVIAAPDLPLFKVTCNPDAPPHPFLGRGFITLRPGPRPWLVNAPMSAPSWCSIRGLRPRALLLQRLRRYTGWRSWSIFTTATKRAFH